MRSIMNEDNAKSPRTSIGNWQAIDVFVFSNGQENSPPRKYHLTSERLGSWDTTLNYMARTLYGLQIRSVDLYSLEGEKIKSPMHLSNGAAYVAVATHETFIPSGYEKYLMRATKNVPFRRSLEKQDKKVRCNECCSADCIKKQGIDTMISKEEDHKISDNVAEPPKLYAYIKEVVSEVHIIVPATEDTKEIKSNENGSIAKKNKDSIDIESINPNTPIVKLQKQTKTLFKRSLTPSPRLVEFKKEADKNKIIPGKINTYNPDVQPVKKYFFKNAIKKTPKPTHKLNDTIHSNFENVPTDVNDKKKGPLQNNKQRRLSGNTEKAPSAHILASVANSQVVIHTLKAETSDQSKRLSVPNLYYPDLNHDNRVSDKCTSTATVDNTVKKYEDRETHMSNIHLKMSNDALISLNKEEFQAIVDRIVERILNEKTNTHNNPKLVYAKVTQSLTEASLAFDQAGRFVSVINGGEVVNFKVNIEVSNLDKPSQTYPENKPRDYAFTNSAFTSTSTALGDASQCNESCDCQSIYERKPPYRRSKTRHQCNDYEEVYCECGSYNAFKHNSNHGDVRLNQDKANIGKKTIDPIIPVSQTEPVNKLPRDSSTTTLLKPDRNALKVDKEQTKLDMSTQTNGLSEILLEAREHPDGRYTFHLPPLQVLQHYNQF